MVKIIKKDGTLEDYNEQKIINAVAKAANRGMVKLTEADYSEICKAVWELLMENEVYESDEVKIEVYDMHNVVETVLDELHPKVAKSYKEYRNYKKDFVHVLDKVYLYAQQIMYLGDKGNANTDSALVATKRSLIYNALSTELYKKFFLTVDEKQAMNDGYIYIHDKGARKDTFNCCLADVGNVMKGGFEMGNLWYNEPKTLSVAFDVLGDLILNTASQQYGGFTVPEIDKILAPYAEKSYEKYRKEYLNLTDEFIKSLSPNHLSDKADKYATEKVKRDFEQGFQGLEMKLNSVGSSRGDYPFVTVTFGLATDKFGKMASITMLDVHREGQGKKGFKKPVLFPKLVFLYDENLHGDGSPEYINGDVFNAGIACSARTMYPDWLSLTGEGYVPSMYKKYKRVVSPMGCVDGNEVITYKLNGSLFVESFQRMWNRLSDIFEPKVQIKGQPHLYMDLQNVQIYDTEKGFVNTKRIVRNVSNNFVDVHLSNGRRLLCTTDHPFEIINKGITKAENLKNGDKLLINSSQYSEEKVAFNKDKAWLLGFMLCAGCYQNSHIFASIAMSGEDEIEHKFHEIFLKYFGMDTKTVIQERGKRGKYKDLCAIADTDTDTNTNTNNNNLQFAINYFTTKFGGINKVNRHIPNEVFSWDYESKVAFMAGMVDADGYINENSQGRAVVQIGSTNKELALQQMALAQALGIPAKIYHNHYTQKNPNAIRYRVEFYAIGELLSYIVCKKKCEHYKENCSEQQKNINANAEVLEVIPVNKTMYSYDVMTDSEHFEVSGIYSHNCRAFLSPWYERGGMHPADKDDKPIFEGRCNLGVVSLHLPMILAKSRQESRDFYEVLDYYLELIRNLHKRTYEYLAEMKASTNPVMFCEGGLYGGHLKPNDTIRPLLRPMTMSYGVTALNELQELYNGKSLVEDGAFALEVMRYINDKVEKFKEEDNILYALYGTPAETLCLDGETLVHTDKGCCVKLKDIKVGDKVRSYNLRTAKVEYKEVLNSQKTGINAEVLKIKFENGSEVVCTAKHKIAMLYMELRGLEAHQMMEFVEARNLRVGNRVPRLVIDSEDGTSYRQTTTKIISIEKVDNRDVYDIEVADNHNFFVGDETNGILVHNCGTQVEQFRSLYGIIKNVSDRTYVSNSFHCHVTEDISPIVKQDKEYRFWDMFNGGKIQYVRYPLGYNINAVRALVLRAMKLGFYEGVNLSLSYCEDCGYEQVDMDKCPECGSENITKVDRMNGYLSYTRVKGETRYNKAKNDEIRDRKSM